MATNSLKTIRRRLSWFLKEPFTLDQPTGYFLPNGTSSSIIRPNPNLNLLWPDDDWWHKGWIYAATGANAGTERRIYDYVASTGDLYVTPAFSSAMTTLDELELHTRNPASHKNERINSAIRTAWPFYWTHETIDLAVPNGAIELNATNCVPFPTDWREILEAWLEPSTDSGESFSATAGGATTVTVGTASWTTNQYADYQVSLYEGTGAGQVRTIVSNTATIITVSSAWTTNPDATTKIQVKQSPESFEWRPVVDVRPIGTPYLERIFIPFWLQNEVGRTFRITGLTEPDTLASDTATTNLPLDYIAYRAASETLLQHGLDGGTHQWEEEQWLGRYFKEQAEAERVRQAFPEPPRTFWKQPRSTATRSGIRADNPFWY